MAAYEATGLINGLGQGLGIIGQAMLQDAYKQDSETRQQTRDEEKELRLQQYKEDWFNFEKSEAMRLRQEEAQRVFDQKAKMLQASADDKYSPARQAYQSAEISDDYTPAQKESDLSILDEMARKEAGRKLTPKEDAIASYQAAMATGDLDMAKSAAGMAQVLSNSDAKEEANRLKAEREAALAVARDARQEYKGKELDLRERNSEMRERYLESKMGRDPMRERRLNRLDADLSRAQNEFDQASSALQENSSVLQEMKSQGKSEYLPEYKKAAEAARKAKINMEAANAKISRLTQDISAMEQGGSDYQQPPGALRSRPESPRQPQGKPSSWQGAYQSFMKNRGG